MKGNRKLNLVVKYVINAEKISHPPNENPYTENDYRGYNILDGMEKYETKKEDYFWFRPLVEKELERKGYGWY